MFNFFKEKLTKIYSNLSQKLANLFRGPINDDAIDELKRLLIASDAGVSTSTKLTEQLKIEMKRGTIVDGKQARHFMETQLHNILSNAPQQDVIPSVLLMVGVNGSGKTTTAAKLANMINKDGKRVLLVAADTFRAAASQQLAVWAKNIDVALTTGKEGQDPASVVFEGCKRWKREQFDHVIIDTAGRLHTNSGLLRELEKIRRVIRQHTSDNNVGVWLSIDAMLGQSSFSQAKLFQKAIGLDSTVLTKFDGTGKGGVVFAIAADLGLSVSFVTFGENLNAIQKFDSDEYINKLLYK